MNIYTQNNLRSNQNNIKFLRENSHWYKYLNRDIVYFKAFESEMKTRYKLTPQDKLDRFSKNIDRISEFIDIFS